MKNLPEKYLDNMQKLLGNEYGEFLLSYEKPSVKGLRFNSKKVRQETVEKLINEWNLKPVPWCSSGYYYPDGLRPGLSPYHDAGVFYIQEPSAMSVIESIEINNTDKVLDLCAAPGGKSTAAAEKCGVLLSNEIMSDRARVLSSNIERMGFSNTVVSSASPERLSSVFPQYFDVVICDAPCSGEGMMRKDDTAISEWSDENVHMCSKRQKDILTHAADMLCPGGRLVYSTCTFEVCENEDQIYSFLKEHKDFTLKNMKRIWPHKEMGEGHFCAVLEKFGEIRKKINFDKTAELKSIEKRLAMEKIHILRSGITKGEFFTDKKGNRIYIPSHAEIMSDVFENCKDAVNIYDHKLVMDYLKGDVLRLNENNAVLKGNDGFTGVFFDGYPLGLGKKNGFTVKNHLPKGLRRIQT